MNIEKLKSILAQHNKVTFKLYSLEYVIEAFDNKIQIYSTTYPNNIRKYSNIDELLNDFKVYNETLIESQERVIIYE